MKVSLSILGILLMLILNPYFNVNASSAQLAANIKIPKITKLKSTPEALVLEGKHDVRSITISGLTSDGYWIDLSKESSFTTNDTKVKIDSAGYVYPVAVGWTTIKVAFRRHSIDLSVNVKNVDTQPISFVRDIMPAISKVGCNAGTCHGAAKGKNGFKLSLRGYDLDLDYQKLITDLSGRRLNRARPAQSLMLLKPTQGVPHGGGQALEVDSRHYKTFHQWIVEGVKSDVDATKRVSRLEVIPHATEIHLPGMAQQLIVIAHYPDGTSRDVTRDAIYSSSLADVATTSDSGFVTAARRGEAVILVRYESLYSTSEIIVIGDRSGFKWAAAPQYNYIDELVYDKLKRVRILPSDLCTDAEFTRRLYLDLTGVPPTPSQVQTFLDDHANSRQKRERLIDHLIGQPEYVEHWTHKWADLLQCNRKFLGEKGVWLFRKWIHDSVAKNKPYDKFVRDLLMASGSTYQNPAANYHLVTTDKTIYQPDVAIENATQLFLGIRFACVKCHDHPFEKWTQNQYYELGSYFSEVGVKRGQLPGEQVVYNNYSVSGGVKHPKTGGIVPANVPFGSAEKIGVDPREAVTNWLVSKDNPWFAKSLVNRVWSYFLGRGIVEPVDDIRSSNPPSNAELLDALTKDFIENDFDLRHLMHTITKSRTYQQSIKTNRWNQEDEINFSHAIPRRLTAEQMLDAVSIATGSHPKFSGVPKGFRAVQLPDSSLDDGGFLKLFGRPERESACECERTTQVSLSHALNLINGPTIASAINDPKGRIAQLTKQKIDNRILVKEVYLATLCRMPNEAELVKAVDHISKTESQAEGAQDLLWALINSPSFLFNR